MFKRFKRKRGIFIRYKNPYYKKPKNTYALEVSCLHCKTPIAIYAKGGKGNLIKMQVPRIVESEMDIKRSAIAGQLVCHNCGEELARQGEYNGNVTFWILRGNIATKRLDGYKI